jgi:glycine/D-amino acid oxidase-like deaminating enzyme
VRALVPLIEPGYVEGGLLEPDAMAIDVSALHEGYLRGLRRRGGLLVTDADIAAVERTGEGWRVETKSGSFGGDVLIDAAGAWADQVRQACGASLDGSAQLRRRRGSGGRTRPRGALVLLAGPQGGFGIMTAPALARIAASLITTGDAGPNSLGLDPASAGPGAAAPPAQRVVES